MDNRITKDRFKIFFTYDILKVVVVTAIIIVVVALIFNIVTKKPNDGQDFYLMFADNISVNEEGENILTDTKDGNLRFSFSYDLLETTKMQLQEAGSYSASYMMTVYLSANQCDLFVCSNNYIDEDTSSMFVTFVENYTAIKIDEYIEAAKTYALKYITVDGDSYITNDDKIRDEFEQKYKRDSRFEKDEDYVKGLEDEKNRIIDVYKNAVILETVLKNHPELLYSYTSENFDGNYAINISKLNGKDGSLIGNDFVCSDNTDEVTNDILLLVRDSESIDGDLYYESLAYINNVIDKYSTYIDEIYEA